MDAGEYKTNLVSQLDQSLGNTSLKSWFNANLIWKQLMMNAGQPNGFVEVHVKVQRVDDGLYRMSLLQ